LSSIIFINPDGMSGNYAATILPTGEIVPTPEPAMVVLLTSGALLLGGFALRRRFCRAR
jgi:hypothetical protein